jgi:hypothetical protein
MKCLTIKQPWAWLIFNDSGVNKGLKNIENRTWHTKIRGTVAIHTSKKVDIGVYNGLVKYSGFILPPLNELECGKRPAYNITDDKRKGTFRSLCCILE